MSAKHTPGPWGMYPDEWTDKATAIIAAPSAGPQNRVIAFIGEECGEDYDTTDDNYRALDETDLANARLIAAAPALLEISRTLVADAQRDYAAIGRERNCDGEYLRKADRASLVLQARAALALVSEDSQ